VIVWLVGISLVGLVLLFRDAVARVLVVLIAVIARLFGGVLGAIMWLRRSAIRSRRRRRRRRVRTDTGPEQPYRQSGSVYDDIPL
jgi:hypothetical protein